MKNLYLSTLIFLFSTLLFAQNKEKTDCNCKETFLWMKTTFSQNDAGFQDVIDKKGLDYYNYFTSKIEKKVKKVKDVNLCSNLLKEWLSFFREGHIGIWPNGNNNIFENENEVDLSDQKIREKYKDSRIIDLTEIQFKELIQQKKKLDPLEGIWNFGNSYKKIGILRDEKNDSIFNCFIIEADSVYWMPKQLKAIFVKESGNFKVEYFLRDHSSQKTSAYFSNTTDYLLNVKLNENDNWCKKTFPLIKNDVQDELFFQFKNNEKPFLLQLSDKTNYIRIPSFSYENKVFIDSVLKANKDILNTTQNLIIDIRYGTGGADVSFENLIPLLYTNPIRGIGNKLYATKINAEGYKYYAEMFKQGGDTVSSKECMDISKMLSQNLGEYLEREKVDSIRLDSVKAFPNQIAIVCNEYNGSTDEEFLLAAKQSKKVKIYGEPTMGALDYSNINEVLSPDGKYKMWITMSKSYRIPDFCIDGVGVQPDYYIDQTIPEDNWINFVLNRMEN